MVLSHPHIPGTVVYLSERGSAEVAVTVNTLALTKSQAEALAYERLRARKEYRRPGAVTFVGMDHRRGVERSEYVFNFLRSGTCAPVLRGVV